MPPTNSKNCVERRIVCRAQDRIWNAGRLDQILLRHLGAEVATVGTAVAADDRQRQMMLHVGGLFRGHQVPARGLEEFEHSLILPHRRVGQIDDDLCVQERLFQSLARDGVDAGIWRGRDGIVTLLLQLLDEL
jgi:hypothetical protein